MENVHRRNRHHVHRGISYRSTVEIMVSVQSGEDVCRSCKSCDQVCMKSSGMDIGDVSYDVPGGLEESLCG